MGKTMVGDAWTGTVQWVAGEGGTPGTSKMIKVTNLAAKTVASSALFPSTWDEAIPSLELDEWDYVGMWMKATKTAHTVAIPWATNGAQLYCWGEYDNERRLQFGFPGSADYLTYLDLGGGWITSLNGNYGMNRGFGNFPNGENRAFPDNAGAASVKVGMAHVAANPYTGIIRPFRRVYSVIYLQPNVAIAGTNTWSFEFRYVYSKR